MEIVKTKDLQLGDVVRLSDNSGPYLDATVVKIENELVHVFRPYVHTSDYVTSNGLTPYIGTETFAMYRTDTTITLLRREKPGAIK